MRAGRGQRAAKPAPNVGEEGERLGAEGAEGADREDGEAELRRQRLLRRDPVLEAAAAVLLVGVSGAARAVRVLAVQTRDAGDVLTAKVRGP